MLAMCIDAGYGPGLSWLPGYTFGTVPPAIQPGTRLKVRFRAPVYPDDALDFTVFLSPAGRWTACRGGNEGVHAQG